MYYCILCEEIHVLKYTNCEIVFTSGFHYYKHSLYSAGMCKCEECILEENHSTKAIATA
ncbi:MULTISPECIES: DUF3973 domain-containing protein [unclassified Paenibacillus]|uniref:DUF3973 domain-containing protein n=1 Tax=unclassified Paenibacillus TaxID=185978 RepID=UPI001AE65EDA|nr:MULTISPECIES: DUF3973 domain-containing protein [unclassified Paenibacillus]MBP1154804.1 hypothetical protein [Paenibacillus sp. PvP091]MBP1169812.1 hypothetical protein [Paenibacillus sp. PvR098]MBP2440840.1 hypothetical protein [Paenibacillus sp. PvP052]